MSRTHLPSLPFGRKVPRAGHPRHAIMLSPITKLLLPLALGCALSVAVLVFSERSHQRLNQANLLIASSIETQAVASQILALVSDAETAQRGFLLTERPEYLEPYVTAVPKIGPKLQRLKDLNADNPEQRAHVSQLAKLIGEKLAELEAALRLYKDKGPKQAQELIETDVGRRTMDEVRKEIDTIQNAERAQLIARSSRWNEDVAFSRAGITVITLFNLLLVITVYILARRGIVQRERIRSMLEEQVRERTAELSELSTSLQNVQEEERARLAHDLHDELGGILVSSKMDVSWAYNRLKEKEPLAAQRLARAMAVLDDGVDIKRRIIEDLRPTVLDNLGLPAALDWYVNHIGQRGNLKCTLSIDPAEVQLPDAVAIALFRVVQEALTNIVRHANAANAWITMEYQNERALLTIRDDGAGLPKGAERKRLSHGILGMRLRITSLGGEFAIESPAGGGTVVRISVPLS